MPEKFEMDKKEMNLKTPTEDAPERVVFFCEAKGGAFSGLVKEDRFNDGSIRVPEKPIRFKDYMYATDDPEEIAFLQKLSKNTIPPRIIECKTMREFEELAHGARLKMAGRYTSSDHLEVTNTYSAGGEGAGNVGLKEEGSEVKAKVALRK